MNPTVNPTNAFARITVDSVGCLSKLPHHGGSAVTDIDERDERLEAALRKWGPPAGVFVAGVMLIVIGTAADADFFTGLGWIALLGGGAWALIKRNPPVGQVATQAPVHFSTTPIPDDVRQRRLQEQLSQEITYSRGRVEAVTPYSAVVVSGQPVNHVLHLLASVFLCGLWIPVWILLAATGGEKRHVLTVDPYGNVARR